MPNWCYTKITINHDDEIGLANLFNLIEMWTSKNYRENGFGHKWLGNVVLGSGVGTVDAGSNTDLRCRGSINYTDLNDNQLIIYTETAWNPMLKMWVKVLEKYLPDAELVYESEECGCGLYSTNDPYMEGRYYIDCWDIENIESDMEASEETVREVLQNLLGTMETDVDRLLRMFEDSDHSENMSIHKWDFDEVGIWE